MKTSLILLISALVANAAPIPATPEKLHPSRRLVGRSNAAPIPATPDKPTAAAAEAKAAAWIKALPQAGLVINEQRAKSGFVGETIAGSKNTMFILNDGPWYVTLGFSGAVSENTPLEKLREQFSYIALDRIPLTGLKLPGWNVRAQTPATPLRKKDDAVEILKAGDGRISFRVKTHFFAVYGSDPSVLVPADASSPKGSYFQVRERFNLDLTVDSPFQFGK